MFALPAAVSQTTSPPHPQRCERRRAIAARSIPPHRCRDRGRAQPEIAAAAHRQADRLCDRRPGPPTVEGLLSTFGETILAKPTALVDGDRDKALTLAMSIRPQKADARLPQPVRANGLFDRTSGSRRPAQRASRVHGFQSAEPRRPNRWRPMRALGAFGRALGRRSTRHADRRHHVGAWSGCSSLRVGRTQLQALPWSAWNPLALASPSDMYSPCLVLPYHLSPLQW